MPAVWGELVSLCAKPRTVQKWRLLAGSRLSAGMDARAGAAARPGCG